MIYHVRKDGESPFSTIQSAADIAIAGDKIIVHEGIYREWVKPFNGGTHDNKRIVYEAAEGEKVVICGSEKVDTWQKVNDTVWKVTLPDSYFGEFNPFTTKLAGDWVVAPLENPVHLGDVYLNGRSMYEAFSFDDVCEAKIRTCSCYETWDHREEKIVDSEYTVYQWFAQWTSGETTIFANFGEYNPNKENVEISKRPACFYPDKCGVNYITVRGFEICNAATQWAPPTADQPGMVGPHWAKGWIIENNIIHDSKCSGISLGKEISTGHNRFSRERVKPGYHNQMEAVFAALSIGWSKENIGSHIIRNNKIYNCGQTGIVGHMGCAFSRIEKNEIYNISKKHEFYGHELGGIKFHAAIDVVIANNYFHHCSLGTWLDWEAQGTRLTGNIYCNNNRDFMIEVTHGPCLLDNNIFASPFSFVNAAQGTAFVNNIIGGFTQHYPELKRSTPYHQPHSTTVRGTTMVYGFDDRVYQNIFTGGDESDRDYGTGFYTGAPASHEEFLERCYAHGKGDLECFDCEIQPVYINDNIYLNKSCAFDKEERNLVNNSFNANLEITDDGQKVVLSIDLPEDYSNIDGELITTEILGYPRLVEEFFENPDGSPIILDTDMLGKHREANNAGPLSDLTSGHNQIVIWER